MDAWTRFHGLTQLPEQNLKHRYLPTDYLFPAFGVALTTVGNGHTILSCGGIDKDPMFAEMLHRPRGE